MISKDEISPLKTTTYVLDEFRFEAENLLLLRNSEVVPLAPKAAEVLLALVAANHCRFKRLRHCAFDSEQ